MPLQETSGAASYDAFGGGAAAVPAYIEEVFSTWLVTPTSSNTTYSVANGIDVSGKGGMVWMKSRSSAGNNLLYDTVRGASAGSNNALISNNTSGQQTANFDYITGLSNGFTVNYATGGGQLTNNGINYASWTFREQAKFFDVVTYTGNGSARTVAHSLGSVPGCIIVKRTDTTSDWQVYHNGLTSAANSIQLNLTAAQASAPTVWNSTTPTSTVFNLGTDASVNASGGTYVAYLFAHNAGGFGLTGLDNVISCGSFTTSSGGATVNLGYEAQWVLVKATGASESWYLLDNMRNMSFSEPGGYLSPNNSNAEPTFGSPMATATSTGFIITNGQLQSSATYIYIAIRRGPMKVPTSGTQVFEPQTWTGTGTDSRVFTGFNFPLDLLMLGSRDAVQFTSYWLTDRLQGASQHLQTASTSAVFNTVNYYTSALDRMNGYVGGLLDNNQVNTSGALRVQYGFRRAPGFFDVVCLNSTTSAAQVLSHNLGVAPELIISKGRNVTVPWQTMDATNYLRLNTDQADIGVPQYHTFTSTTFSINSGACSSGENWVFYLFATLAGVSKYGTYTGTGTTQTINCGFTAGARFVLIKRTDSTGDWYVWDSARGIVAGNDPYLLLNSTAAEVTSTDYVDTASTGFEISSTAPAAINASGGTFIFLAIA